MISALTLPLAHAMTISVRGAMTLPFEAARQQYSLAVKVGLQPNSMLAYREHFKSLDRLEKATLGAFARQV